MVNKVSAFKTLDPNFVLLPDAVIFIDPTGHIVHWTGHAQSLLGYTESEARGLPLSFFHHASLRPTFTQKILATLEATGEFSGEIACVHKDGRELLLEARGCAARSEDGALLVVVYRDIADRQKREALQARLEQEAVEAKNTLDLAARENEFRLLADTIPQLVWISDNTASCSYFNRQWLEFTGTTLADALGWGWLRSVMPEDIARIKPIWEKAVLEGGPYAAEYRLRRHDGVYRWVLATGVALKDASGKIVKWFGTSTDHEYARALEEAVNARDAFLSMASHELKTPLASLKMQVQHYRTIVDDSGEPPPPDQYRTYLRSIEKQIDRMNRLVSDMLDVSRITAGKVPMRTENVDLAKVMQESLDRFSPQMQQAGCVATLISESPRAGNWDPFQIEQVITNLLTNALRYAPQRPLEIDVRPASRGSRAGAEIRVKDHGPGIAPEDRARIFERFVRLSGKENIRGLGLGLYISRQIALAHDGELTVESAPGHGARFTLWLPY